MNFSTDRDLLALEPEVFNDLPFVSQQRVSVNDAELTGTQLFSMSADFVQAQVSSGAVVLIDKKPYEVAERIDENTLEVSLLRARVGDTPIPGESGAALSLSARTFAPQAALVCSAILRMLGIDSDNPEQALDEDAVVSVSAVARLESLGTLERIYSSGAALTGNNDVLLFKAGEYRRRFLDAAARQPIQIDTTGDGYPDEKRYLGLMRLVRA